MHNPLTKLLFKFVALLGLGMPFTAQAGLLTEGCDMGVEYDCVAKQWLEKSPNNKRHPPTPDAENHLISPELRKQLDERIEKEQKEFEKFLTDARDRPVTHGMAPVAPLPNKSAVRDISYTPLAEQLANSHIAEIQAGIYKASQNQSGAKVKQEDWFEPIANSSAPTKKVHETSYEKPLLMKILERIYAFDTIDFIVLLLFFGMARLAVIPFTRL